jgi:hypothetical protein
VQTSFVDAGSKLFGGVNKTASHTFPRICTVRGGTSGKFANGGNIVGSNLPLVSATPAVNFLPMTVITLSDCLHLKLHILFKKSIFQ